MSIQDLIDFFDSLPVSLDTINLIIFLVVLAYLAYRWWSPNRTARRRKLKKILAYQFMSMPVYLVILLIVLVIMAGMFADWYITERYPGGIDLSRRLF